MWRMYMELNPQRRASYFVYLRIFNDDFNIKFGYPRTDICETCDRLDWKIRLAKSRSENEKVKGLEEERDTHLADAEIFHTKMKDSKAKARKKKTHHVICFDFEKNLPLPLTNSQSEYYKRQLWLYNFCVHNVGEGNGTMFLYAEHYAAKSPNEVISCVDYYLRNYLPEGTKSLDIFCDNCAGQNKNRFNLFFFHLLAKTKGIKIKVHFPIPGHSYMPCDQDFALIEKERRRKQKVFCPSEWVQMIRDARSNNKFTVIFVQYPLTDDMKQDFTPICSVLDYKSAFNNYVVNQIVGGLLDVRGFKFVKNDIMARMTLCSKEYYSVDLDRNKEYSAETVLRSAKQAYCSFLPVNVKKVTDVMSLLQSACDVEKIPFYSYIVGVKNVPDICFDEVQF